MIQVELSIPDLGYGVVEACLGRMEVESALFDRRNSSSVIALKFLRALALEVCQFDTSLRGLQQCVRLRELDFIRLWVDREQQVALLHEGTVLKVDASQCSTHLGSEFNLPRSGELTEN